MKKESDKQHKQSFLDIISSMTPEEINELILNKGKEAKLIDPLVPIEIDYMGGK